MAKIDVLLPVRNGKDFLAESLNSISAQTERDWRLLVLDHGSTDGSLELAEAHRARDPRVEVHSLPQAQGLAGLLNCGLDLADCGYLMRHDADDICYPDRMARTLAAFAADKECIVLSGQADIIDATGAITGQLHVPVGRARVSAASLFNNPINHPAAMFDFAAASRLGVRYGVDFLRVLPAADRIEVPNLAEDYFMFGQLAVAGKCGNLPHRLIRYRRHGANVGMTKFNDQMAMSLQVSRYLARIFCASHNVPLFDPAPFCNHGGRWFDVDGQSDFDAAFASMADSLRRGFGPSVGLERELAFRRVGARRQVPSVLWRYFQFQAKHKAEAGEWNAVRSWLLRSLPGKSGMRIAPALQ